MNDDFWLKMFPIGSRVHIGYCEAEIIGVSKMKWYGPTIKLKPKITDPIGARMLGEKVFDVSYAAMKDFKLISMPKHKEKAAE